MYKQIMKTVRRRSLLGAGVGALALAVSLGMQIGAASADALVLRYNKWLPQTHPQDVEGILPFFKEIERVTEGRVRVEPTTASLAPPPRQMEAVQNGVVDIAYGGQSLTPGLFPLADVVALPFIGDSAEAISVAFWRTHNKYFAKAEPYKGVHVLSLLAVAPYQIYSIDKKIDSIDDLAGMKLRATGAVAPKVAEAIGAVPIPIDITGMYDALSKKILDGALNNDDQMRAFGVVEFVKHRLAVPGGILGTPIYIIINEGKWNQISEKDQAAIMDLAGETIGAKVSRLADISAAKGVRDMEAKGAVLTTADEAMLTELKTRLKPIEDAWIAKAAELGVDGRAALDMMRSVAAEVEAKKEPIKVD
jgi:TRAP-type C4-dicarboxylate transport system substrate-binding protein